MRKMLVASIFASLAGPTFAQSLSSTFYVNAPPNAQVADVDRQLVVTTIAKTGGLLELAAIPKTLEMRRLSVSENDYPAWALRNEEQGVVRSWAIFGPDGRLAYVETNGPSANLTKYSARLVLFRTIGRLAQLSKHRGRFVRAPLPTLYFRIIDGPDPQLSEPVPEGAVVLSGKQPVYQELPASHHHWIVHTEELRAKELKRK